MGTEGEGRAGSRTGRSDRRPILILPSREVNHEDEALHEDPERERRSVVWLNTINSATPSKIWCHYWDSIILEFQSFDKKRPAPTTTSPMTCLNRGPVQNHNPYLPVAQTSSF